jgi:hypothetical protein
VTKTARPALHPAEIPHAGGNNDHSTLRRLLLLLLILFLLLFLVVPGVSFGGPQEPWFEAPSRDLALRVARVIGRQDAVSVRFENRSSLSPAEFSAIRAALEEAMKKAGAHLTEGTGTAGVTFTLSEKPSGLLWVAEVSFDDRREILILEAARPGPESAGTEVPAVVIRKELVIEQDMPILDFAVINLPDGRFFDLVLLDAAGVTLYHREANQWVVRSSYPARANAAASRDLRGRIEEDKNFFTVHLPGLECKGHAYREVEFGCEERDPARSEVPLFSSEEVEELAAWVPGRNYFTLEFRNIGGMVRSRQIVFSAAPAGPKDDTPWVRADLDGVARLYTEDRALADLGMWGSDVAAIESSCGSGHQILATGVGDWTERDTVQAYQVDGAGAVAVSVPLELPGPVTALWTASDARRAAAVVRSLITGKYEAYSLAISCGR